MHSSTLHSPFLRTMPGEYPGIEEDAASAEDAAEERAANGFGLVRRASPLLVAVLGECHITRKVAFAVKALDPLRPEVMPALDESATHGAVVFFAFLVMRFSGAHGGSLSLVGGREGGRSRLRLWLVSEDLARTCCGRQFFRCARSCGSWA
jgi:hypothetical protein